MPTHYPSQRKDSFDILQELVRVVTPQKLQKAKPIFFYDKKQKIRLLYDGLRLRKWNTDADASHEIYGKKVKNGTFSKLKSDLGEKLLSDVLLINLGDSEINESKKAFKDCLLRYHTAILLYRFTPYHKTPNVILEKIFPKCLRYEFTELIIGISEILSWKYKLVNDVKKGAYYEEILLSYLRIQNCECKGKIFLGNIYAQYARTRSFLPGIALQVTTYLDQLGDHELPFQTQKMVYFRKMLEVIFEMSMFNYRKTAELCEQSIAFFENRSFFMPSHVRSFYFQAVASYTYLRETEKGYQLLDKCHKLLVGKGSTNWFKLQELKVVLAFYGKDYGTALQVFSETTCNERFNKQTSQVQEYWKLVEAKLYILHASGKINSNGHSFQIRFSSLSNSVPLLIRDKKGLNFALHLIRFFMLLEKRSERSQSNFVDHLDSLGSYVNRYCREQNMHRSRWIYQLLVQISRNRFEKKLVLACPETKLLLQQLEITPYDITDANLDIEIIPFDHFFLLLCEKLQ